MTRLSATDLRANLAILLREPLRAVRYLVPCGEFCPQWHQGGPHEVEHGVELENQAGTTLALLWQMDNHSQYLSARLADGPQQPPTELIEAVDVSDLPAWQPYLGVQLSRAGASWHIPWNCEDSHLWSVRLGGPDQAFTIALGELRASQPTYLPDSVVVLFGQRQAKNYRITDADPPAWGADLPLDE